MISESQAMKLIASGKTAAPRRVRGPAACDLKTRGQRPCAWVLILSKEQAGWLERLPPNPRMGILVRPITLKHLYMKLTELLPQR